MKIKQLIANFLKEEDGLTTVEYAIAGGVVSTTVLTEFQDLADKVADVLEGMADVLKVPAPTP